jgi:hypothetical protein
MFFVTGEYKYILKYFLDEKKMSFSEVAKQNKIKDRLGELGGKTVKYTSADPAIWGLFVQE